MSHEGHKISEEHRRILSEATRKNNLRLGKVPPSRKGKVNSPEHRQKISLGHAKRRIANGGSLENKLWALSSKERLAGRNRPETCELCGAFGVICFDHDHMTGKFRGWICNRCNTVLGFVKDNIQLLEAMGSYLRKFQ